MHHQLGYEAVAVAVIGRSAMSPKDSLEVETQQGIDLAVGVAGAVILYFVVQSKIKKARKFRRDMEYGSARWGTEADKGNMEVHIS